ncbi:MAG: quinolinate synthase NadA [Bacteroidetes bacterium]|nr:quinolinate synthase NadA [Bacteroidota bacterium]MBL6942872.1 quinolinate synthase NadA [Bacteroidales bacterium]
MNYTAEILKFKKEKNVLILAHFYQIPEIQELADYVGDSLGLAQKASEANVDMIVFAGVHFMAETAKMLNPDTLVVLPDLEAGCSLADSCPVDKFIEFKKKYPNHLVISYINTTAAIKTLTDIVCTSGNAVQIVESLPKNQKIIFAPDKNLGGYINRITGRNMVLWNGICEVHDILTTEAIIKLKEENPDASVIAHPECNAPVLSLADFIGSTTGMIKFTQLDKNRRYIVATESGIIHQMQKLSPEKEFLIVPSDSTCNCNDCSFMKLNTLEKLYLALKNETPAIKLDIDVIEKAKKPILRMLDISKKLKII